MLDQQIFWIISKRDIEKQSNTQLAFLKAILYFLLLSLSSDRSRTAVT